MSKEDDERLRRLEGTRIVSVGATRTLPPFAGVLERRYYEDATFRYAVDMLEALMHRAELSPMDVRSAAMIACIHYETRNVRGIYKVIQKHGALHIEEERAIDDAEARIAQLKEWIEKTPIPE